MSNRNLGCFVSCAGGLFNIFDRGEAAGANIVMTHPAPPQRWNSQPFKDEVVDKYLERKGAGTTIERTYFHGIYLINLANPDKQKFHLSKLSIVNHMDLLNKIGGDGVIFHTGSLKDYADGEESKAYDQVAYGLNWIFENLTTKTQGKKLFLECAAGSGSVVGDRFEELAQIYEKIKSEFQPHIGFCLDTQHMFASGYDIVNDLDGVVAQIEKYLGLENITAVHFNDSKTDFASHKDRHENLGSHDAKIGEEAMKAFLNHPLLRELDFLLETPELDTPEGAKAQMDILKSWAE